MKLQINTKLALLLLNTNKQFILYNLDSTGKKIVNYRLTNDYELTGNNRNYTNFKVISCVKNNLLNITF